MLNILESELNRKEPYWPYSESRAIQIIFKPKNKFEFCSLFEKFLNSKNEDLKMSRFLISGKESGKEGVSHAEVGKKIKSLVKFDAFRVRVVLVRHTRLNLNNNGFT